MGFNLSFKVLNAELNSICHPLALLGAHHIFHVSGLRVNVVETIAKLHKFFNLTAVNIPRVFFII